MSKVIDRFTMNATDFEIVEEVSKFNPNHDEAGRFSSGAGGAATGVLSKVTGKVIDLGSYPQDRLGNPDDPYGYKTDEKKMGEVIHTQGWDKPSLGLSETEFEELATNPDFVRVYRGAPAASVQAMIDGKPYIGNGAVGPGTYVSTNRSRAEAYVNEPGYKVIEMLVPKVLLDGAATRSQQRIATTQKYGESYFYDTDVPKVLSASQGNGATWNGEWTRFPNDYTIYNTSAIVVKVG